MDREPAGLANYIERTLSGLMWHGPALAELLSGVSPTQASAHPIADAHSIWEIVLHYTVSRLLHGVIGHGTYHGGQIALLKKARAGGQP